MTAPAKRDMAVLPVTVSVSSETNPDVTYLVQLPYCPCKDFRYRRAALMVGEPGLTLVDLFCKHLRQGLALVGGWHQPEPELFEDLTRTLAMEVLTAHMSEEQAALLLARSTDGAPSRRAAQKGSLGEVVVSMHEGRVRGRYDIRIYPVQK